MIQFAVTILTYSALLTFTGLVVLPAFASARTFFKGGHFPDSYGLMFLVGGTTAVIHDWIDIGPAGQVVKQLVNLCGF